MAPWPDRIEAMDFIVLTCSLTESNRHMINGSVLGRCKRGVKVINVARGPLIDEAALVGALASGQVGGTALDVFEEEPLPPDSALRGFSQCIFGSHNSSNTRDAVTRTSLEAIEKLYGFLHR